MNESLDDDFTLSPPSMLSKVLQTTVLCPTIVANLFGNICVCLAVARVHSFRRRPSSSIFASLALSDISVSSFLLFRLIWLYDFDGASKLCELFVILLGTLSVISIIHICLLSCDRYVAIVYPLRYRTIITRRRVRWALAVAWGAPIVAKLILPFSYRDVGGSNFRSSLIGCSKSGSEPLLVHKVHLAFNVTLFVMFPFAAMVFIYGRIAKISLSQSNRTEPGEHLNPEMAELRRMKRKEMKWMKTIVIVIGAFTLCYLPGFIVAVLAAKRGSIAVPSALKPTLVLLMGINSALNPIIYMFRSSPFQRAVRNIFRGASIAAQTNDDSIVPPGRSRVELSVRGSRNNRLPSFLSAPHVNVSSLGLRSEVAASLENASCHEVKTFPFCQDHTSTFLTVLNEKRVSSLKSAGSTDVCLETVSFNHLLQDYSLSTTLTVPNENVTSTEPRSEIPATTSRDSTSSVEVCQKVKDHAL